MRNSSIIRSYLPLLLCPVRLLPAESHHSFGASRPTSISPPLLVPSMRKGDGVESSPSQTLLWPGRRHLFDCATCYSSTISLRHLWWMIGFGSLPSSADSTT